MAEDLWRGMPEFENEEQIVRMIYVNFRSEKDVQAFFDLIGQKCTPKTKHIHYPEKKRRSLAALRWAAE